MIKLTILFFALLFISATYFVFGEKNVNGENDVIVGYGIMYEIGTENIIDEFTEVDQENIDSKMSELLIVEESQEEVIEVVEIETASVEEDTSEDYEEYEAEVEYVEEAVPYTSAADDEFMTLCAVVEAETHGAGSDAKMRIVFVIRNRVLDGRFPSSYYGVCTQSNQFASRWDIEQSTIDAVNAALESGDTTGGALWFCTCSSGCWASDNASYMFTDSVGHHFWR